MSRLEFTGKTKMAAWERAGGRCEHRDTSRPEGWQVCSKKLHPGDIFYDHIIPGNISKDNSLANCQVLCRAHHDEKTRKADIPTIAKVKRIQAKHIGAGKRKRPMSDPRYKQKIGGGVVYRATGEPVGRRP